MEGSITLKQLLRRSIEVVPNRVYQGSTTNVTRANRFAHIR
jgi:hypothetical protein